MTGSEPRAWVLDTNVIVSGLLSPDGPPGRLVDMLIARRLLLAVDDRIEQEYRDVLARPALRIDRQRREAFLAILQFQIHVTSTPWPHSACPDPDDTAFLEVAREMPECTLVTGNLRHFPERCHGPVRVLSPRDAWATFTC